MVVRIDENWMFVKVPTGKDCGVCHGKDACIFKGPDRAYRTLRLTRPDGYGVGDRVTVEEPGSMLGAAALAVLVVPVLLLLIGYQVYECCVDSSLDVFVLWIIGFGIWVAGLAGTNRWMMRSPRFEPRIISHTSAGPP